MQGLALGKAIAIAGLALLAAGCAGIRTEITRERSLLEADRRFAQISLNQGAGVAMRAMMAPENSMLSRMEGEYIGAEQATKAFPPLGLGQTEVLYWDPEKAWISADDNLGVTTGRFVRTVNGIQREQGRYVSIWKRDINGAWRSDLTVTNNDMPATPAPFLMPGPITPTPAPTPTPTPRRR